MIPHWAAADARDADLPLRRAGRHPLALGHRDQPRGVAARAAPHPHPALARPFLVVQDLYLTETAHLADVVLPGATAGEKTGSFTNADRTVHLSEKAVDPPGEARADLDILLDFARRMDFRDRDGRPLPVARCRVGVRVLDGVTAGPPCDQTGLSYAAARRLRHPVALHGRPPARHRAALRRRPFPRTPTTARTTAATSSPARSPETLPGDPTPTAGRCSMLPRRRPAGPRAPTARSRSSRAGPWCTSTPGRRPGAPGAAGGRAGGLGGVRPRDAERLGLGAGDLVEVRTPRGRLRARLRLTGIREGVLFVPFHYGYWDVERGDDRRPHDRAANELTPTDWDPVSKQPIFKLAAVAVTKVADGGGTAKPAPMIGGSAPLESTALAHGRSNRSGAT